MNITVKNAKTKDCRILVISGAAPLLRLAALWSVTEGCKRPIEYYLSSKRRMLSYKNVRLKVTGTAKKRADEGLDAWKSYVSDKLSMSESKRERESQAECEEERRLADLKRSSSEHKR
jgi:hypothetical protein